MASRIISKLSTLDAARTVFFIIVGLAIKQSLGLLGHTWPSKDLPDAPAQWDIWTRAFIGLGYLCTVIRFSHGVTLLYGYEKERIESSSLPSASKVSMLSLFLVLLAIPLLLMADNIGQLESYIFWTAVMLGVDLLYIWQSNVVRMPLRRLRKLRSNTEGGTAPRAALWWMLTDVLLLIICGLFYIRTPLGDVLSQSPSARHLIFAGWLILITVMDYLRNRHFYFGGKGDQRKQKFVFVCSPLRADTELAYRENITRAQFYCLKLMKWRGWRAKKITPFASHAFFTYFLNDDVPEDRALGRECAIAYLSACDAVYAYAPLVDVPDAAERGKTVKKYRLSHGMEHEVKEAKRFGLEIKYLREIRELTGPDTWSRPPGWRKITFALEPKPRKTSENYFRGAEQRKKVYVCTRFRGPGFDEKLWQEKREILQRNTSIALWHCHELVRDVDEAVAPFAPQAFYPYFWDIKKGTGVDEDVDKEGKWKEWFDRSIEVLKVCDAVYVYTTDGMPPMDVFDPNKPTAGVLDPKQPASDNSSDGVRLVVKTAKRLGLEIQFRKELPLPSEDKKLEKPLNEARRKLQKAVERLVELYDAAQTAAALAGEQRRSADQLSAEAERPQPGAEGAEVVAGDGQVSDEALAGRVAESRRNAEAQARRAEQAKNVEAAYRLAAIRKGTAERLARKAQEAEAKVQEAQEELTKLTWSPAVPYF